MVAALRPRALGESELSFSWRPRRVAEPLPADALELLASLAQVTLPPNGGEGGCSHLPDYSRSNCTRQQVSASPYMLWTAGEDGPHPLLSTSSSTEDRFRFDPRRFGNCQLTRAFGHVLKMPCLPEPPRRADWRALLKGHTVNFVGDSMAFQLFTPLCVVLSPGLNGLLGGWNGGADLGAGSGQARTFLQARFDHGTTLRWCWFTDNTCIYHANNNLRGASLIIYHHGAWENPLEKHVKPIIEAIKPYARSGSPLIWLEYAATHFPGGLGDFEDRGRPLGADRHREAANLSSLHGPCMSLDSCISPYAAARLNIRHHFNALDVPVLRYFDISRERLEQHPLPLVAKMMPRGKRPTEDCRHFCSPGSLVSGVAHRMFAMLSPPTTPSHACTRLQRLAADAPRPNESACYVEPWMRHSESI